MEQEKKGQCSGSKLDQCHAETASLDHDREQTELLGKPQPGMHSSVSHCSQRLCVPTLAVLHSKGLFTCLTLPLDCELCNGSSVTHQQICLARSQCLMDEQTSVTLVLDRVCGCQCVLCMFYLPSLELLHSPVRHRNIPKEDLTSSQRRKLRFRQRN